MGGELNGLEILPPQSLADFNWDEIIIVSTSSMNIIKKQLIDMGVVENSINTSYVDFQVRARTTFLRDYAQIVYHEGMTGSVAEAGVFQGEFASIINKYFPDRELYLFDTFAGFDSRDIVFEKTKNYSDAVEGHLGITSERIVLDKMEYPNKCIICKGYFPESARGIHENFVFVNLDMDLYKPTLEGLRFFWPLLVPGGIIVIHDFFSSGYEGVNAALYEFSDEMVKKQKRRLIPFPIGDHVSVALQKS